MYQIPLENNDNYSSLYRPIQNSHESTDTFEEFIVKSYRQRLVDMLNRLTQDKALAEDLAHETLIVIFEKLRKSNLNEPSKLASYVFSTARYLYFGWLRKKDNQTELGFDIDNVTANEKHAEDEIQYQQELQLLQDSIMNSDIERDRTLLTRMYLFDQEKSEICDILQISSRHFDRVNSRARKRLKLTVSAIE